MTSRTSIAPAEPSSAYAQLKPVLRRFVDGYLSGEKPTHVVGKLRPKLKEPRYLARKWLGRADVQAAIAERRVNILEAADIHQEMIVRELGRIAFSRHRDLYDQHGNVRPVHELDDETGAQIAGFEVEETITGEGATRLVTRVTKVKRWDKRQALRDLAAIAGIDKSAEGGGGGTIFNIQINL